MAAIKDIPRLGDRLEQVIKEVRAWSNVTAKKMRYRIASLTLDERIRLSQSLRLESSVKGRVNSRNLELERVSFRFLRHGIFLERGVGRGRPANSAAARRAAKPWIKPILDMEIDELADIISEEYADIGASLIVIKVPGVYDSQITGGKVGDTITYNDGDRDIKIVIDPSFF